MTIADKISSIRNAVGIEYSKPSPEKMGGFVDNLNTSPIAQEYLLKRGIASNTAKNFNLGYDKERNAIAIPVYKRSELINIRYRLIDPQGNIKYTQERGCEVWLYNDVGVDIGLKKGGILITEGEFDCMSAWQAGFKNVVSPASGKDSYGIWLELLDNIPKVYIAYDNDKPGKLSAKKMAERIDVEKCQEVFYPEGIKDTNEYFSKFEKSDFVQLLKEARPFYKYKFSNVGDVLSDLRDFRGDVLKSIYLPYLEIEEDWLIVVSARSNVGKTALVLNIANELASKDIPTLVLPIERGARAVGKRFLQIKFGMTNQDFKYLEDEDWDKMTKDIINLPLYFSVPSPSEAQDIIAQAKRIFDTRVVIIDHFDLLVRKSGGKKNDEAERLIMELKQLAQELGIIFIIVHHIRKQETTSQKPKRPIMEDLKGVASLYQDPEAVIMLHNLEDGKLEINTIKNKGTMGYKILNFNTEKGIISEINKSKIKDENIITEGEPTKEDKKYMEDLWNSCA